MPSAPAAIHQRDRRRGGPCPAVFRAEAEKARAVAEEEGTTRHEERERREAEEQGQREAE